MEYVCTGFTVKQTCGGDFKSAACYFDAVDLLALTVEFPYSPQWGEPKYAVNTQCCRLWHRNAADQATADFKNTQKKFFKKGLSFERKRLIFTEIKGHKRSAEAVSSR